MKLEERIKAIEVVALGMDPPVVADASTTLRAVVRRMRDERRALRRPSSSRAHWPWRSTV